MSEPRVGVGGVFLGLLRLIVQVAHLTRRWSIFSKGVIHLFVKPSLETSEAQELQMRYSRESLQP